MQILLITQEPPLKPDAIATGNAIRTAQLEGALGRAGHEVSQTWLDKQDTSHQRAFRSRDELQATITRQRPDAILVAYWELLELLPFDLPHPVIVDFVAPRPLEVLFENPEQVSPELKKLQANLSKCDLLLTGNEAQRELLWFTLLQAGFDLRGSEPVMVVPLSAEVAGKPETDPRTSDWTLVGGGVHWAWRKSEEYWQAIQDMKDDPATETPRLVLFGGQYRWQEDEPRHSGPGHASTDYKIQELAPYAFFSRYLLESAHIGLEVAQVNIERKHSQSFRSLEFLRHGLPLICNDYLPIARLVDQYEAGWTVKGPEDLAGLLQSIMKNPDDWERRSKNALRLVEEALNPDITVKPLLDWLEMPTKAPRLPVAKQNPAPVVLGIPPWPERLKRQARLIRRIGLSWLFRVDAETETFNNVLIVTRSDLFPDDHGAAVKIVETARGLSQHGCKVGIVSDDRKHWWLFENGERRRLRLPFWLRFLSLPHSLVRLLHHSKNLPESNSFLYLPLTDSSFFWHCLYAGRQLNAGILQAEFPAYAKPCIEARDILNASVVLVEHNVEYARLKAQVAELSNEQFQNLRAIEIDLCNRSDAVVCVSDNDRQQLLSDGVKPELLNTIPHGFDPEQYKLPAVSSLSSDFGLPDDAVLIAFHGTFSYPPNRDAITVFAETLLPQLASSRYSFHVIAIGRNPPANSPHPNIHFTGSVEEVGPWLKACDLAVIPLREGGGTRMKIIDCFAAGLPVVSTSKGIEGIPVVNGREAFISDDWVSITNEIIELAESKEHRQELSTAAMKFAAEMDWKSLGKRYLGIFSAIRRTAK
ncbi:MAG: glycosyltransferase family 4 protein [Gammaproteobacteria bacterium]|nr:glycosyltransferase family 4 protein [Gammaproteobacteria bacterium]